jgi:hypothetical protein
VRRAGEDAVYAVRGYSSWRFAERTEDWIDKVYFTAPRERIARIAIDNESGSFGLERAGEEGWVLIGGGDARLPAEADKVDSLLRAMSRVSLSELVGRIDDEDLELGTRWRNVRSIRASHEIELPAATTLTNAASRNKHR